MLISFCAVFGATGTLAIAASGSRIPPGGPAPKALLGTWTTTLTNADVDKFGVQGRLIHIQCLDDKAGFPLNGHDTFMWSAGKDDLRFKLVAQHCRGKQDRDAAVVLVSRPWRHPTGLMKHRS